MGYTTNFDGRFYVEPPLDEETHELLTGLATTRRMARDVDPKYGVEGEFYIFDDRGNGVIDLNKPPKTQPGLWCQWVPTNDGHAIEWDGGEKFYNYVDWIKYLIESILKPRGFSLSGAVTWVGEDPDDRGKINISDNVVKVQKAKIEYVDE